MAASITNGTATLTLNSAAKDVLALRAAWLAAEDALVADGHADAMRSWEMSGRFHGDERPVEVTAAQRTLIDAASKAWVRFDAKLASTATLFQVHENDVIGWESE